MSACLKFVQRVQRAFSSNGGHDSVTWAAPKNNVSIVQAKPGFVKAKLTLAQHNVNRLGSMHGGLIATLTDTMGSLAIASKGFYSTGVSTDINTTFVKAAGGVGDEVVAEGSVISLGKTLAFTRMELRHPVTNALLAYGSHTKFMGKAVGHAENVEFDEAGEKVVKGKPVEEWVEETSL